MKAVEVTLRIPLDEEMLELHDGEQKAPPNDPEDWDARDIFDAADEMILERDEAEILGFIEIVTVKGSDDA